MAVSDPRAGSDLQGNPRHRAVSTLPIDHDPHAAHGFDALLFDLDGTLVDSPIDFPAMKQEMIDLTRVHGLDFERYQRLDILGIVDAAGNDLGGGEPERRFRAEADRLLTVREVAAARLTKELCGAVRTLTVLKEQGIAIGIVTRNCAVAVAATLQRVPLPHDVLLTRHDVERVKPDPQGLWIAAERLGCSSARCAMVGDHAMDIAAGRAAGMYAIGVAPVEVAAIRFSTNPPDLVLPGVDQLLLWMFPSSSSTGIREICSGER